MADVSLGSLMLIAFATGIGGGIGTPLGNFLYKKYWEPKLEKAHEKLQKLTAEDVVAKFPQVSDEKIRELLGKKP